MVFFECLGFFYYLKNKIKIKMGIIFFYYFNI